MATEGDVMTDRVSGVQRAAPGEVRVRRALLSVSDKHGIVELARGLAELGVELVSTGGTSRELSAAGIAVRAIEDFTGLPGDHGRAREDAASAAVRGAAGAARRGRAPARRGRAGDRAGGPGVREPVPVRADARARRRHRRGGDREHRHRRSDDDQGRGQEQRVRGGRRGSGRLRARAGRAARVRRQAVAVARARQLAAKAFACTARYDAAIASWFAGRTYEGFPPTWSDAYEKVSDLRYGENPHQQAAFYARVGSPTHLLAGVEQLHGKELSFNNLLDLSSARELVEEFDEPACAIVKHNNPCGCAVGDERPRGLRTRLRVRPRRAPTAA